MVNLNNALFTFRGQRADHIYGTVIDREDITTDEVRKLAGHDFEVRAVKNYQHLVPCIRNEGAINEDGTPAMDRIEAEGQLLLKIPNDPEGEVISLATVGKDYYPIQEDVKYGFISRLVEEGLIKHDSAGTIGNGKVAWNMTTLTGPPAIITRSDNRETEMLKNIFWRSNHDGKGSWTAGLSAFFPVCNNQMNAIMSGLKSAIRIRHSKKAEVTLQDALEVLNELIVSYDQFIEALQLLANNPMTPGEAELFFRQWANWYRGELARTQFADDRKFELAYDRREKAIADLSWYNSYGSGNKGVDRLDAYSAITDYLDHNKERYEQSVNYANQILINNSVSVLGKNPMAGKSRALEVLSTW